MKFQSFPYLPSVGLNRQQEMCVIFALVIARLGFETRQNEIETILYALRRNLKVIDGFCKLRKFCFWDLHYKSVTKNMLADYGEGHI